MHLPVLILVLILHLRVIMSFTLFNPSRLKSCMLIKYSAQEPLRLGFRPSLSHKFSSLRDEVTLNDGRKGWIHEKKGGWFTIAVPSNNGQEQVKSRLLFCF